MKKVLAVAAVLLTFSTSAFAAPPPGAFTGHSHHSHISSSHRVHVGPPHPMHTPTGNRVRMTPTHGQTGPVGGRMSSMHHGHRHSSVHVGPRVYVRRPCRLRLAGVTQAITHAPTVTALYGMGTPYPTTTAIPTEFITADTMHPPASTSA